MGYAYRGTGLVDMLTAGTTGPVCVNAQVFFIYFNIDGIIEFGENKNRGK